MVMRISYLGFCALGGLNNPKLFTRYNKHTENIEYFMMRWTP